MARKGQGIEILTGWQAELGSEDFLRELVQRTVQQVLEAEMTSFLGAESYQRNAERRGWRNGFKPRTLKTRVGALELMVPKDRDGQFQTELFERYQRSEKAFVAALLQMYVEGVSTRKVTEITEALCGLEVSKSQVSALTAKLDAEVAEWRMRRLLDPAEEGQRPAARLAQPGRPRRRARGRLGRGRRRGLEQGAEEDEDRTGDGLRRRRPRT